MLLLKFFKWWYGHGWATALQDTHKNLGLVSEAFSVSTLLRTLFAPWHRITTNPGRGLDAYMRAMIDNAVSRLIGFIVRSSVLFAAGCMLAAFAVIGLLELIVWPLLPVASIVLIIWGVV